MSFLILLPNLTLKLYQELVVTNNGLKSIDVENLIFLKTLILDKNVE